MIWFGRRARACSCTLPPSFLRWSLMGIKPTIASIPSYRDVLNVLKIHMATLLYIFPKPWADMLVVHGDKTKVESHIGLIEEYNIYIVSIFA